jgi:la-related protein 1
MTAQEQPQGYVQLPHPSPHPPPPSQLPLPPTQQLSTLQIGNGGSQAPVFGSIDLKPPQINGEKQIVFGSIKDGLDNGQSTSPDSGPSPATEAGDGDGRPKSFTAFSIGVPPEEGLSQPLWSKTRSKKVKKRKEELTNGNTETVTEKDKGAGAGKDVKVIDLTDPCTKWEFGSTKRLGSEKQTLECEDGPKVDDIVVLQNHPMPTHQEVLYDPPPLQQPYLSNSPTNGLPMHMPTPTAIPMHMTTPYTFQPPHSGHLNQPMAGRDEFLEVQDFGYGFGHVSGTGYGQLMVREMRERERERDRWDWEGRAGMEWGRDKDWGGRDRDRDREFRPENQREFREREGPREFRGDREFIPVRRGRGAPYAPSSGPGGFVHERGSFGRGRALRGRGYGGRNYGRGGLQQQQHPQTRQPPFIATPPAPLQSLPSHSPVDPANGYFPPHHTTYYPTPGYELYQPPAPAPATAPVSVPLSSVPFPLDPIRSQLLGQLEYYLSSQNMASDFFLRQRVRDLFFSWFAIQSNCFK